MHLGFQQLTFSLLEDKIGIIPPTLPVGLMHLQHMPHQLSMTYGEGMSIFHSAPAFSKTSRGNQDQRAAAEGTDGFPSLRVCAYVAHLSGTDPAALPRGGMVDQRTLSKLFPFLYIQSPSQALGMKKNRTTQHCHGNWDGYLPAP